MKTFSWTWLNEYRRIGNDTGALLILVGAVIFYALVYPFPYRQEVLTDVPVAVVDLDHTALSRQLARSVDATQGAAVTARPADPALAREMLASGRVKGICLIPVGFGRDLQRGESAAVTGFCDGSNVYLYKTVARSLLLATGDLSARLEMRTLMADGQMIPAALARRDPLPLERVYLFNPAGGYASYAVPAILVMILQQTLLVGIGLIDGTANEAAAGRAPERPVGWPTAAARVLGRAVAYLSIHLVLAVFVLGLMIRWHRYPQNGVFTDVLRFILPMLLAAVLLGISLGGMFSSREKVLPVLVTASIPLIFLSGFSWPSEAMPLWLQLPAALVPSTSGIKGFFAINHMGAALADVGGLYRQLWLLCGIYFLTACLATRRASRFEIPS
jgi:ABC-2 type transport system permease protein